MSNRNCGGEANTYEVSYSLDGDTLTLTAGESCANLNWCIVQWILETAYLTFINGGILPALGCNECKQEYEVSWYRNERRAVFSNISLDGLDSEVFPDAAGFVYVLRGGLRGSEEYDLTWRPCYSVPLDECACPNVLSVRLGMAPSSCSDKPFINATVCDGEAALEDDENDIGTWGVLNTTPFSCLAYTEAVPTPNEPFCCFPRRSNSQFIYWTGLSKYFTLGYSFDLGGGILLCVGTWVAVVKPEVGFYYRGEVVAEEEEDFA